jgi:hypothetical protein
MPKSTESGLTPIIHFLRDISWYAHQLIPWCEFPENLTLLEVLHDLGGAILTVAQEGLDTSRIEGYSLLHHEIERGRTTIKDFFKRHEILYKVLDSLASSKREQMTWWARAEVPRLKTKLLSQIESIKILTLVNQM